MPSCQQCLVASSTCVQRRFGSIIDASDPSSISYIESLKSRIRILELRTDELDSSDDSPNQRRSSNVLDSNETIDPSPERNDLQDAMHEASYLSLSAMAEPTGRQRSSPQGLSFLTFLLAAMSVGGANPSLPVGNNVSLSGHMAEFRNTIFPHGRSLNGVQMTAAFETFVAKMSGLFPFMTRRELQEEFDLVTGDVERVTNESPEKIVIVSIGIAIGLLLSPMYNFTEVLASELATRAMQLIPRIFDHTADIAVVQCLTVLTIYSLYTPHGGSAWHLLGLAMTRSISCGMHTSRASDLDAASRAFWTLYILDTYLSTTFDRPFCLNDRDIMVSPPSSPRTDADTADTAVLRHLTQHAQILRAIRTEGEEDALCHFVNLRHWKESMPRTTSPNVFEQEQLYIRGIIEICKSPTTAGDPGRNTIMQYAMDQLTNYVNLFEHRITSQDGTPSCLDGHLVFAIGVVIATQQPNAERQRSNFQCANSLTILSTRYCAVQGLRNVLSALQCRSTSSEQIRIEVDHSEIAVSSKLQRLIFGAEVDAHGTGP
jgi:hypothetical protein